MGAGQPNGVGARGRLAGVRRVLQVWRRVEGLRYRPTVRQLADEFQVHWRTIARDLAVLEELRFAVPPEVPAHFADAEPVRPPAWSERHA